MRRAVLLGVALLLVTETAQAHRLEERDAQRAAGRTTRAIVRSIDGSLFDTVTGDPRRRTRHRFGFPVLIWSEGEKYRAYIVVRLRHGTLTTSWRWTRRP